MAMLEVKDLNVFYGNIHAIKGVSLHVNQGEIVSLIGANGAGKTTILQTISGLIRAKSGQILFEGEDITSLRAHKICKKGIAQVPEGRRVFANLTVSDNINLGAYTIRDTKENKKKDRKAFYDKFPRMRGLSPIFVKEIFDTIKVLKKEGVTILLVEQNAKMALSIADRGYVLETGNIKLEGDSKELLRNENVKKAYLGA